MFNLVTIFAGILFALINIFHYAGEPTLGADIVSRVLPAEAHRIGLGVPYKNFWEITPPGHYIVLDVWSQFFGFSPLSIKTLHLVASILIVFLVFYTLRNVVSGVYLNISAGLIYFFLFSTRLTTFILPAEILASLFSIAGLASLYYFKNYRKAIFISAFLFFFSGQVKDPFLLSGLALLPYVLFLLLKSKKDFYDGILFSVLGVISSAGINILYLFLLGSIKDYISILNYKSIAFNVFDLSWLSENFLVHIDFGKDVFFYLGYSIFLPILILLAVTVFIKLRNKSLNLKIVSNNGQKYIKSTFNSNLVEGKVWPMIFFVLGLSIGFVMQRSLGSHYYIVLVMPLIIFITLCFYYTDKKLASIKKTKWLRVLMLLFFLSFLFPKKAYFIDYNFNNILNIRFIPKLAIWADKNKVTPILDKIDTKTTKDECILDIYGWGVGTTYLYSERRPCTRFFIANLVVEDWQRLEYKSNIITNTPSAIIYNPTAGDLDYKSFEGRVINFPKILKNCYIQDSDYKTLYWPKVKADKLKMCIQENASA